MYFFHPIDEWAKIVLQRMPRELKNPESLENTEFINAKLFAPPYS